MVSSRCTRYCVLCRKKRHDYFYRFPERYYDAILIPRFKERRKEKWLWCRRCYLSPEGARFRDDPASDNEIEVALASNYNNGIIIDDEISHQSIESDIQQEELRVSEHNESVDREFIEQLAMANQASTLVIPAPTTPVTPQTPIVVNNKNFNININLTPPGVGNIGETKKAVGTLLRAMLNLRPGDTLMLGIDDSLLTTNDILQMQAHNTNNNTDDNQRNSLNKE